LDIARATYNKMLINLTLFRVWR